MGDEACEIEEIEEKEATMAAVQERRKANYDPPEFSDGGPHTSPRDISPTLAQNGGDEIDEQQRRHRKGKEGSGGLPLYIFLQESVANGGGKKVDPRCPNASNPYHVCTDHCRTKMNEAKKDVAPKSPFSFLSRHSSFSSSDGSSRDGSKVDPRCPNASNPYHECTENCRSKFHLTDREDGAKSLLRILSRGSPTSSGGSSVDLGENRKVDPRCVNSSNPYHECGDHCLEKLRQGNHTVPKTPDSSSSRKSKGSMQKVERSEDVHPGCVNASNPYHQCGNYCFEKMQR